MSLPVGIDIVGGISGDPAVLCVLKNTTTRFLLDLGDLAPLPKRELVRTHHAFVSHTHIDHFIGFDQWLRVHISQRQRLFVSGPRGFVKQVSAKLGGYTWNLLDAGQIQFTVREIWEDGRVWSCDLSSDHGFACSEYRLYSSDGKVCEFECGGVMKGIALDHGTPSIGYRFECAPRVKVSAEEIAKIGLEPGPWIKELQALVANGDEAKGVMRIGDCDFDVATLESLVLTRCEPFSIGYITDLEFSEKNAADLLAGFGKVTVLISESSFLDEDRDRAATKKHLTARHAAWFGAALAASELRVFHVSNIYGNNGAQVVKQAAEFFAGFKSIAREKLLQQLSSKI